MKDNNQGRVAASAEQTYSIIGTRPSRVDASDKVTGRARYAPDVTLPRLAYGKVLRSPHAHARIRGIDTSRAEALPGVYAVVTARDLPEAEDRTTNAGEGTVNYKYLSDNNLASDKVLYMGHPLAAVAASSVHVAEEALQLIQVDYEILPSVTDVLEAMAEGAPLLHENMVTRSLAASTSRPSNVASHFRQLKGDPDRAMAQAEVVIEREFRTATVHQGYLEPHAATATWSPNGHLTIYTTTQGAFDVRSQVAALLHCPEAQVQVIPTEVGGAFGGKNISYVDVTAALLARKADRPVRVVMTRAEVLSASGPTSASVIRVQVGAHKDGHLAAVKAQLFFAAGAYPGGPVGSGANCMLGPYDIPNAQVDGYDVLVNRPKTASYRGPGATQACFAIESVLDELAERLHLDPLELRLLNCAHEGTTRPSGEAHGPIACEEVIRAAQAHPHYSAPLNGPNQGRGVAIGFWPNWGARSSATLTVNEDGTVTMLTGSVDITGTRTSLAMQAAEVLGLPLETVRGTVGDTDTVGYSDSSGGSRTTMATGIAVVRAAHELIAGMKSRAAELWGIAEADVTYDHGTLRGNGADSDLEISFQELASVASSMSGAVRGKGDVSIHEYGGTFAAHIVDAEVDPETGKVHLLRYTAIQDVGRAIHPGQVEGQIQGGVAQGIGWALYEGYAYNDDGRLINPNLLDYKMPTALDVPSVEAVAIESPWKDHPFGVRGVGEVPIVPPPAAIVNAIYHATGARITELPATPERILKGMGVI